MIPGKTPTKVFRTVPVGCINRSQGKKKVFKMQFLKTFLSETTMPRAFIIGIYYTTIVVDNDLDFLVAAYSCGQ